MTTKTWLVMLLWSAQLCSHCQREPRKVWVRPDMAGILEVNSDGRKTPRDLWQEGDIGIRLVGKLDLKSNKDLITLVMVRFPLASLLADSLRQSEHTLVFDPGTAQRPGFAMVGLSHQAELDQLAANAHAANNSCGSLQIVRGLGLIDPATVTLIPPLYATAVKIDGVAAVIPKVNDAMITRLATSIQQLEALPTRFHTSTSGATVPALVQQMITDAAAGNIPGIRYQQITHASTPQKSLVVTIPGTNDPQATGPVVIIGAHLDSINKTDIKSAAPGADDDASGIATLVEITRQIESGHLKFQRTVELHAYAAEEVGLVGSGDIAAGYSAAKRQVASMLQLDMDSWAAKSSSQTIYLVENDSSFTLRRYAKALLNNYLGGDYIVRALKAGTSDHRSWRNAGYATLFPFEDPTDYNESLHTPQDTSSTINNKALTGRFVQLCLAYLIHEAGLIGVEADYSANLAALRASSESDLKLAIVASDTPESFHVSIAAATKISTVELCLTTNAKDLSCSREMVGATYADAALGRAFFAVDHAMPISAGSHMVVYGYDSADKLVALRTLKFAAR